MSACGGGHSPTTTSTSSSTTTTSLPTSSRTVTLGTVNPATGDCTTNTSETGRAVGSVLLTVTPTTFEATIQLLRGSPSTTYGILLQQVPGSCPQYSANGGTLTTGTLGRGHAVAAVPRVMGATTFFVQLVHGNSEYTSDRITLDP